MKKTYINPKSQLIRMNVENMIMATSPTFDVNVDNSSNNMVDGNTSLSDEKQDNFWGNTSW